MTKRQSDRVTNLLFDSNIALCLICWQSVFLDAVIHGSVDEVVDLHSKYNHISGSRVQIGFNAWPKVLHFFVACYATLHPTLSICLSVHLSVSPSIGLSHFTFLFFFCGLKPHCSCRNDKATSNMAPAHPRATWAAVYPAFLTRK